MKHQYYVYILANKKNGTLYIGVTNNLEKRYSEHKQEIKESFTKKYGIHLLVYYEMFSNINEAIKREKALKNWHRKWKIDLIEKSNPDWIDICESERKDKNFMDSESSSE